MIDEKGVKTLHGMSSFCRNLSLFKKKTGTAAPKMRFIFQRYDQP
jgi:hypothetical protein